MSEESIFKQGSKIDVGNKVKQKNGLSYLSWASAWAEFKKLYPDGKVVVKRQIVMDGETERSRPWFDDGKTGWVEVEVFVGNESATEWLPILDFKNKAIPVEAITSLEANKAYKRCLVKAIAMLTGIGLYIYEGEDMPEEVIKVKTLQEECLALIKQKCKDESLIKNVGDTCKSTLPEECNGDPKLCDDAETLMKLKKALIGMRSAPAKGSMDDMKKEIVNLCTQLGGVSNKELMAKLKEYAPSGNPNSIRSEQKLRECLEAIKGMA
jgi:hypothetical protein